MGNSSFQDLEKGSRTFKNTILDSQIMLKKTVLYFLIFISSPLKALDENNLSVVYEILEKKDFYELGHFQGENQVTLRWGKFGKHKGSKGSLVFVNGKSENILKYLELFYDLYLLGWSPIYTYDHRGQGFSQRSLPSEAEGFIENYAHYKKDLEVFINLTAKDKDLNKDSLFLIAHSMGATIALDYLKDSQKPIFQAAVLADPMIEIQTPVANFFQKPILVGLKGFCSVMPCKMSFPSLRTERRYKLFTNSQSRFAFSKHIEKKNPQVISQGISLRWIVESFTATKNLKQIQKTQIPFLILQAKQGQIVSKESQNFFCLKLGDCCTLTEIDGQHEIFLEKDKPRNKAIQRMLSFFSNKARFQKCKTQNNF